MGNGFTLAEIVDGKAKSATSAVWDPIRGGSGQLAFAGSADRDVGFEVVQDVAGYCSWGFEFDSESLRVRKEWFDKMYDSRPVGKSAPAPVLSSWLRPEEYGHTFYCARDEETGESKIVPLDEVPHFKEVLSKQPIGDLFAEGWMEGAL
jgi:hypothetical protein